MVKPGDTLWPLAASRYGGDPAKASGASATGTGSRGPRSRPGTILYLPAGRVVPSVRTLYAAEAPRPNN